jgi:DNA repair protein RecO (recombination protein O)
LRAVANNFSPVAGGVVCPACTPAQSGLRPLSVKALKVLRLFQQGVYGQAKQLRIDHDLGVELEGLLRGCLRIYSERDLHSLRFLHEVRRDITPASRVPYVVS